MVRSVEIAILLKVLLLIILVTNCAHEENFPALGQRLASPVDVAVSVAGDYFYVLNADYDRTYNRGSILVLDAEGNKLNAVAVPRMARNLSVAGDKLLVTFDRNTTVDDATVQLYSLAQPSKPSLLKSWKIDCMPLSVVMRSEFSYFFVSCAQGELFLGDHANLSLKHVRTYRHPRRALHLDSQRGLLFAFVGAVNRQLLSAMTLTDRFTYTEEGEEIDKPDGIPDAWAKIKDSQPIFRSFQYAVYDIFAARDASPQFPHREDDDLDAEMHLVHYPRWQETRASDSKTYHTNFYDAHPDPEDKDSFYLSQRGRSDSAANNIVKATIDDNHQLQFEVVHSADADDELNFPGDIEVKKINDNKMLLVNSFRGFVNWPREQVFFGVTARTLTQPSWQQSCNSQLRDESYYRFAVNQHGTVMVTSFYGNRVYIFQLQPGKSFICADNIIE